MKIPTKRLLLLFPFLLFGFALAFFLVADFKRPPIHLASPAPAASVSKLWSAAATSRPVYRYSLIPGGVRTVAELHERVASDAMLSERFEQFDWSSARISKLPADLLVFVNFRKDGKISWTRQRILVRAGQEIISDGVRTILTRCGNEISFVLQTPVEYLPPGTLDLEVGTVAQPPLPVPVQCCDNPLPPSPPPAQCCVSPSPPLPSQVQCCVDPIPPPPAPAQCCGGVLSEVPEIDAEGAMAALTLLAGLLAIGLGSGRSIRGPPHD